MLRQLIMVPVIMLCATGGTIGLLKLIQNNHEDDAFHKDPLAKNMEEQSNKNAKG